MVLNTYKPLIGCHMWMCFCLKVIQLFLWIPSSWPSYGQLPATKFAIHAEKLSFLKCQLNLKQADQYLWRHHRQGGSRWWMHAVSTGICTVAFKHCWSKASVKIQGQTKRGIVGNCSSQCSQNWTYTLRPCMWAREITLRCAKRFTESPNKTPHIRRQVFLSWSLNSKLCSSTRPEIWFVCVCCLS